MLSKKIKLAKEAEYEATQKHKEWSIKAESALKDRVKQAVDLWVNNDQDRSKTFEYPLMPFYVEGKSIFELTDISTLLNRAADSACNTVYDPEFELKYDIGFKPPHEVLSELSATYEVTFKIVERAVRLVTDRQLTVERAARAEKYATELAEIETKIKTELDKWGHSLDEATNVFIPVITSIPQTEFVHLLFDTAANMCDRENKYPTNYRLEYTISHSTIRFRYRLLPQIPDELLNRPNPDTVVSADEAKRLLMSKEELARKRLELEEKKKLLETLNPV